MGKQKNRVTKWSPVSPMDFPRFESWLEEMAGKGFLVHRVQQNCFSLARVKFRRDEPHPHRRYRVCPAQGQQQAREEPSQELLELYAGAGWTGGPGALHRPGLLTVRPALSKRQPALLSFPPRLESMAVYSHRGYGYGPPSIPPPGRPPGHPIPGLPGPAVGPAGADPGK